MKKATRFYASLRDASLSRQREWGGSDKIDLSFRGLELAGEVGEALNKVKKLVRFYDGIQGNTLQGDVEMDLKKEIAAELADVIICADLLAADMDIDLRRAVMDKFNITSDKHSIKIKLIDGNL